MLTAWENGIIIVFALMLLGIGYLFSKNINSMEEYYLGNRSLPWSLIVGTLVASLVMVVILGVSVGVFSKTIFNWILIFGGNDLSLWGIIANGIANLI